MELYIGQILYGVGILGEEREYKIVNMDETKLLLEFKSKSGGKVVSKYKEFSKDAINDKIFFKMEDCLKNKDNIIKKMQEKYENEKQENIKENIKKNAPRIKLTQQEKIKKLKQYSNESYSKKEEKEFYEKCDKDYFARMDVECKYYEVPYYNRLYITKNLKKQTKQVTQYEPTPYKIASHTVDPGYYLKPKTKTKPVIKNLDEENGLMVIDWRTEVAKAIYDTSRVRDVYTIGDYNYSVMLKRKFKFAPLRYKNTYIMNDKLYNGNTIDPFLLDTIKDKKNESGLTDIISTIQEKQNDIIRCKLHQNFILQGCAGSGKTMILLHRLSYLQYHEDNKLAKANINKDLKIITPNKLYNTFVDNLSRELDIDNIPQSTIVDYYIDLNNRYFKEYKRIETEDIRLNSELDLKNKSMKNKFKGNFSEEKYFNENDLSEELIKDLYDKETFKYIKNRYNEIINSSLVDIKEYIKDIKIQGNYMCNKEYIKRIIKSLTKLIFKERSLIKQLKVENERLINVISNDYNNIDNMKKRKAEHEINKQKPIKNRNIVLEKINILDKNALDYYKSEEFNEELEKLNFEIKILDNKIELCNMNLKYFEKKGNLYKTKLQRNLNKIKEKENLVSLFIDTINNKLIKVYYSYNIFETILEEVKFLINMDRENKYSKAILIYLLYINYLHSGKLQNSDKMLCIDEGQDYNKFEYELIKNINGENLILNIYGDINQSSYVQGIKDWNEINMNNEFEKYEINENYRNTDEITQYVNKALGFNFTPLGLDGEQVEEIKIDYINNIIKEVNSKNKKIAVIVKDLDNIPDLKNRKDNLLKYLTVSEVKGLEYNTVIVFDKDMNDMEKYIAYTRALAKLYVVK